jgi:hypothetical protein
VEILNVLHNGQPFDRTDDEQAAIEMWIIENPPEPDYPEDY